MKEPSVKPSAAGNGETSPATSAALPPPLVEFRHVTKRFSEGPEAKVAIEDVSFTVEDLPDHGEMIGIVGPSGCGKSTILRILGGLRPHFPPSSGKVLLHGKPVERAGADRGMVDQKYSLLPHLTVLDNVAFGLKLAGVAKAERRGRAVEWVKKVGLDGSEKKYPSELSGGMQQRVAIAATLILQPRILLMDEPFGALDPKIRLQMQELLVKLWREQQSTVFLVTHSVEEAIYLGDRVLRLAARPGRLIEVLEVPRPDEPPEVMRRQPWFREAEQELLRRLEDDLPAGGPLARP
jgi:NitT/TauT family transport system ATP-binding protein